MLEIRNLHVSLDSTKEILAGIDLQVPPGQLHVIMGPNGSGKSTLANVLSGRDGYVVSEGSVIFKNQDLLSLTPEQRAACGLFHAFQYPVEIPGVNNSYFLRTALNSIRQQRGLPDMDALDFLKLVKEKLPLAQLNEEFLHRAVNEGFSGGEKKRNELLQMLILEPELAVLDETDSGLDVDSLKTIATTIKQLRDGRRSFIVITHYQRLLEYIVPDAVHVLLKGKIIRSGDQSLAAMIEAKGYGWLL